MTFFYKNYVFKKRMYPSYNIIIRIKLILKINSIQLHYLGLITEVYVL